MATWPTTLPAPQKSISIVPGDTRKERKSQSGRSEFRRFGNGKPDLMKAFFRLTWAEWDILKEFHAHELNLGINWFSADWLTSLGYDVHEAKFLGYPREVALQNYYVDILCNLIIQKTEWIVIDDTEWPCEYEGFEPPPPSEAYGYACAGYNGIFLQDCDEYNPIANTWASKTNIPLPARNDLAASTIGIAGYVYGGGATTGLLQDCDQYTPNIKTWTSKTNIPLPARNGLVASTIGSAGYIYGGRDWPPVYLPDCDQYTPDVWVSKTDMPLPGRWYFAASTIGSAGYVYGGYSGYLQDCDEYNPIANTWASKTNMPLPARSDLAASTIGSAGYVYGGISPTYLQDCDEYTPDTWTSKTNMPLPARGRLAASTIGSSGYIYGGISPPTYSRDCDRYTPSVNTWVTLTDMPLSGSGYLAALTI